MNTDNLKMANLSKEIATLEVEIGTLSTMEINTRKKANGTRRLLLKRLFRKPKKKTEYNYWSSQDVDSINSIILLDPDEVKIIIDFKQAKLERLRKELAEL